MPSFGPALFKQHPMVYWVVIGTLALGWFLYRSRAGLVLRAVGESPESAHALGDPERRIRLAAVVASGALCGLSGAYISVIYTPLWVEGKIAGKGWIALALTTFATWRPARVLLGAYLFGGVTMLQFHSSSPAGPHQLKPAPRCRTDLPRRWSPRTGSVCSGQRPW